jgi:hypothetical protein
MTHNAFIRNRAEEFELDVWSSYVLPQYFPRLGLREARKSCVLEGGRGCGKTALLRYLSYHSQFSTSRTTIPTDALRTVGLYLKADTQYFSSFIGYEIDERRWQDIFEHALCLALAEQVVGALLTLNKTSERRDKFGHLEEINFNYAVQGFVGADVPRDVEGFAKWLRLERQTLSRWFKNIDAVKQPIMLSLKEFLTALIVEVRNKLPYMAESVFAVYIDEYENLLDYQQRFLNTLIKSGEPPLIFHVAMKPNGMRIRGTIGTESIQAESDYHAIPLDDYLKHDFKLFCAELFFFRLITELGLPEDATPVLTSDLRSETSFEIRSTLTYQQRVLSEVERILPGRRYRELAHDVLVDNSLRARWKKIVEDGLGSQASQLQAEDFFDLEQPDASVCCAALLHQKSKTADVVLAELKNLRNGVETKFDGWTHSFLLGSLLLIHLPLRQKACPIYSGFDAFVQLSGVSIRHFLELCRLSVGDNFSQTQLNSFLITTERQAEAAAVASRKFRLEVSNCGDHGNRLYALVNILGKIFRLSQARYSQSEPERTHFSIVGDELSPQAAVVLREAVKWSVLIPAEETKVKGLRYESTDYVLNQIYAPFFGISFRKGRKLEIPAREAEIMLAGNLDDLTQLIRKYDRQWGPEGSDQMLLGLED